MSEQLTLWLPWAVFGVIVVIVALWKRYGKSETLEGVLEQLLPDEFEPLAKQVIVLAVNAVEQKIKAYEKMTNAQKLDLAKKYARELMTLTGRDLSDVAIEALIEAELFIRHQVLKAPAVPVAPEG